MNARQLALILVALAGQQMVYAASDKVQPDPQNLKKLSLEELMSVEVTLASRQPERLASTAAAISVITRDDIRRSGVTTIADALSLATGVHVARFNNGTWAISARGFNATTANKLLVMVDGRDETTPLFTGVFWNMLDYVLDDIDRIEVIRGPGATLWGANAVNGVINILTRHSRDTRGTIVSAGAGNEDPAIVEVRHGGGSMDLSYRVYGKFAARGDQQLSTGIANDDARQRGQAGLRIDATRGADAWMLKTDIFSSRDDFIARRDGEFGLGTIHGKFIRELSSTSRLQVSSYYRREYRNVEKQLTHHLDTFDIDLQHSSKPSSRHAFIWGAAYRFNHDVTHGSTAVRFDPTRRTYPLYSGFVQDEWAVRPGSVFVTAGMKLEHNGFGGADWQPNVRARWTVTPRQTLWGSAARAVRRPTRFDDDIAVGSINGVPLVRGSDDFESEAMTGWETGYRVQPRANVSIDVTGFVQSYDRLRSQEAPLAGPIPIDLGNTLNGRSSGVELALGFQPLKRLRTEASYSYLDLEITRDAGSRDVSNGASEANDPHHLFTLRGAVDLAGDIEVDGWLRHVSALPNPAVPGFTELNARVGWQFRPTVEFALVGQDLLHGSHPEFGAAVPARVQFERSVRATVTFTLQ
jgi:iron complex outermembrane recepter protein